MSRAAIDMSDPHSLYRVLVEQAQQTGDALRNTQKRLLELREAADPIEATKERTEILFGMVFEITNQQTLLMAALARVIATQGDGTRIVSAGVGSLRGIPGGRIQ